MYSRFRGPQLLVACFLFACFGPAKASVVLHVDSGGILTGASSVSVDGALYDVQFKDGSCNSVFDGCDPSEFAFRSEAESYAASQALLSEVFLDTPAGSFKSTPWLTAGCNPFGYVVCVTQTPYATYIDQNTQLLYYHTTDEENWTPHSNSTDGILTQYVDFYVGYDFTGDTRLTFALWTRHVASVPEPPTLALLCLGLVGLCLSRRRTKAVLNL